MPTSLTLNANQDVSSTLGTAAKLVSTQTGTTSSGVSTKIGTATGWIEVHPQGTGTLTSFSSIQNPTGNGWLFDVTTLENQQIVSGNWQWIQKARVTAGTATITMVQRYYKYNHGTGAYTSIGSVTLSSQSFTSTQTVYTSASTSLGSMNFATGDKLYIDFWINITANSTGSTSASFGLQTCNNAGLGLTNIAQITTPGYSASGVTPVLATAPTSLTFVAQAGGSNPSTQTDALSETAGAGSAWTSAIVYGSGSGWLGISPTFGTLAANGTSNITYTCTTGSLTVGTYTATVTYTATTGGAQATVVVTFTITAIYTSSPYGVTLNVGGGKAPISYEMLETFASFTNGGTIPFTIRYQYQWKYVETSQGTYGGWGPLDETVDKITSTPGLQILLPLQGAPSWWCNIDSKGNNVGYGNGVVPDGPAMATFASAVAKRYGNRIAVYQVGNEEWDTAVQNGGILAPVFNYVAPAIAQYSSSPIIAGAVRRLPPGGAHVSNWMTNFFTYTPKSGEPAQSLPYAMDFHYYRDGSTITSNQSNLAPDPATTDNSANPTNATTPSVQGEVAIIQGILNTYSSNTQLWCCEFGWNLPCSNPNNKQSGLATIPTQQSRYTRTFWAQLQQAGADAGYLYTSCSYTDPKTLSGQSITDITAYIAATPQWSENVNAPAAYTVTSVDTLSYEGTPSQKPPDQYFALTNQATSSASWSIASNAAWLSAVTLPTNGIGGNTGGGLTNGTILAGQTLSFACTADSTHTGLTTSTEVTGTLTITMGGTNYTISVSLFVEDNNAAPSVTQSSTSLTFTKSYGAADPGSQAIVVTNADTFATNWYAFDTAEWLSLDVTSGSISAGGTQTINVSVNGTGLAPGNYIENVTVAVTPFPPSYTTQNPPAVVQFVAFIIHFNINSTTAANIWASTSALTFQAVASGSIPASQPFFINNCTKSAQNWTTSIAYGSGSGWLSLSPTSGTGLPSNGSSTGTSPNTQATDYAIITATIASTALTAGTYTATVTVTLGGTATATITVTYIVSSSSGTSTIGASPTTLSLTSPQGGSAVSGTVTLTNSGNTAGTWTHANAYSSGNGWITSVTPGTGSLAGSGGTTNVTITCTPGNRAINTYTGTVTFTLGSSTAVVTITFSVTSPTSGAIINVNPASMNFTANVGGGNPAAQIATAQNTGTQTGTWTSSISYANATGWLSLSPSNGTLGVNATTNISVFVDDTGLTNATYSATVTFVMGGTTDTLFITFTVSPPQTAPGGTYANLLSLAVRKVQVVKVYDPNGNYLGIWRDAPHLTSYKMTMNAASSQVKMTLPRKIDAYGGAGQSGTDNTVVLGNTVQIWLYGPYLPQTGFLRFSGIIDTIEPAIDEHNAETVTVTLTPYDSVVADHGLGGAHQLTNVDPLSLFAWWFQNNDTTPNVGGVTFAYPLTLDPSNPTSSGLYVNYNILSQTIKSTFDIAMTMLGSGWFWRCNPNQTLTINKIATTAQHTLLLGQHISSLSYSADNNQRSNVICFQGSTGIFIKVSGSSAAPIGQGGIGERIHFSQDSRITDVSTANVIAVGLLSQLDQVFTRTKCRVFDFRGDTRSRLGFDIETLKVGDTITIRDTRGAGQQTTYGNSKYGQAAYGQSGGGVFNSVVPILSIDYHFEYVDIECGQFTASQDRQMFAIYKKLSDFTSSFF